MLFCGNPLVHCRASALVPIQEFLDAGVDRNYYWMHALSDAEYAGVMRDPHPNVLGYDFAQSPLVRYDFAFPPTLRIGMIQVLERVGGAGAESMLVELLAWISTEKDSANIASQIGRFCAEPQL